MVTVVDTPDTWKWQKPGTASRVIPIIPVMATIQSEHA